MMKRSGCLHTLYLEVECGPNLFGEWTMWKQLSSSIATPASRHLLSAKQSSRGPARKKLFAVTRRPLPSSNTTEMLRKRTKDRKKRSCPRSPHP
jgi:hypothetical protein